jgi:GNAT superfamily N-acetyltransferase
VVSSVIVRSLSSADDLAVLTELLHRAYAKHAERNLRYWATHQTKEDTAKRFASGQGFVAMLDGKVVGTITVRPPNAASAIALYRHPGTWTLCQFAVLPEFQGRGIARLQHAAAIEHARANGGALMAIDTAAPATEVLDLYLRWGYSVVGECDWRPQTNYLSIVMSKSILPAA